MQNWFKTQNYQILDLNNIYSFWIETREISRVFCKDEDETVWIIGEFKTEREAKLYIDEIYTKAERL